MVVIVLSLFTIVIAAYYGSMQLTTEEAIKMGDCLKE